jgi:predicted dehydrogenase
MRDLSCYALNWCLSLDDTAVARTTVNAVLTASGVDESVRAVIEFASGVTAQMRCSMAPAGNSIRRLQVDGSKGTNALSRPIPAAASSAAARPILSLMRRQGRPIITNLQQSSKRSPMAAHCRPKALRSCDNRPHLTGSVRSSG